MRLLARVALGSLCAFMPVAEAAASGSDVIDDCTKHGTLTRRYSQRDYRQALAQLPTDVDEYGDCRNIIHDAQVAGAADGDGTRRSVAAAPARGNQPPSGPTAALNTGGTPASGTRPATNGGASTGDDRNAVDPPAPHSTTPPMPTRTAP
jgi:hypothetical protein